MRLRIRHVGLTVALSALPAAAQSPARAVPPAAPTSPAATLGRLNLDDAPEQTARGQFAPTPIPRFDNRQPVRFQPGTGQPGETLPPPKPLPNPKVGEERNGGTNPGVPVGPGIPIGPGVPIGPGYPIQPVPQPVPYAQPVPAGYPIGPFTGVPVPAGTPLFPRTPVYDHVGMPPAVVPGCDPSGGFGGGVGGAVIPVTPGAAGGAACPATPGATADGFAAGPVMNDPYLGAPGYGYGYGFFPRARQVLGNAVGYGNGRLQVTGEYLLWFTRAASSPPLLTTSSPQFNGILGQGDTRVLFGGEGQMLNNNRHNGARFGALYYLPGNRWGAEMNVWFLARTTNSFVTDTTENPLLARPFTNLNTGQQFSEVVAAPGVATGAASVDATTNLWGLDANLRRGLWCGPCGRIDFLLGYKYANLNETLRIREQFVRTPDSNPNVGAPFTSGQIEDRFETSNDFYGVNLGLAGEWRRGRWFVNGRATVGLGTVYQDTFIAGSQRLVTAGGNVVTANSGLLAIDGANAGYATRARFAVMPEVGLTVGCYITPRLRVGVGYGFQYLNRVLRPGGIIDTGLDVTRIPNFPLNPAPAALGTTRPQLQYRETDFFAQGISFSLQWTW